MIRLRDLLKEDRSNLKYGCAMITFTFPEIEEIHELIDENDIYYGEDDDFGLETEAHTTLLYGLHDEVTLEQIENVYDDNTFYTCKVHNPSLFQNDDYDVLKFEVTEGTLNRVNSQLTMLPHTTDYPDYNPHLTIAYLKPGEGEKYVGLLNMMDMNEYWLAPQEGLYSTSEGEKHKIPIMVD